MLFICLKSIFNDKIDEFFVFIKDENNLLNKFTSFLPDAGESI